MQARFYFHPQPDEPKHTFIASPLLPAPSTFGGWGPSI